MKFLSIAALSVALLGATPGSGFNGEQLAYVPVTPCRVADTRVVTAFTCNPLNWGGCVHTISSISAWIVAGDETREGFKDLTIPFSFAEQGGEPNGCGVPMDAKAVTLNVAVNPIHAGAGHLRVWTYETMGHIAWDGSRIPAKAPKASILNWPSDHNRVSWYNNTVTVAICDPETAKFNDCNEDILVQSFPFGRQPVRLVIDVQGYFTKIF